MGESRWEIAQNNLQNEWLTLYMFCRELGVDAIRAGLIANGMEKAVFDAIPVLVRDVAAGLKLAISSEYANAYQTANAEATRQPLAPGQQDEPAADPAR